MGMMCFSISILHPDLIWMISKLYERVIELVLGDFRTDLLQYHRRGLASGARNVWKRFQHIASTIILVINNRVVT